MAQSTITLKRSPSTRAWVALYGGPEGDRVFQLFGQRWLPTAFTAKAEPGRVLAAIQRLNPGVEVRLSRPTPQVGHGIGGRS